MTENECVCGREHGEKVNWLHNYVFKTNSRLKKYLISVMNEVERIKGQELLRLRLDRLEDALEVLYRSEDFADEEARFLALSNNADVIQNLLWDDVNVRMDEVEVVDDFPDELHEPLLLSSPGVEIVTITSPIPDVIPQQEHCRMTEVLENLNLDPDYEN